MFDVRKETALKRANKGDKFLFNGQVYVMTRKAKKDRLGIDYRSYFVTEEAIARYGDIELARKNESGYLLCSQQLELMEG